MGETHRGRRNTEGRGGEWRITQVAIFQTMTGGKNTHTNALMEQQKGVLINVDAHLKSFVNT